MNKEQLKQFIGEKIGEASMCWIPTPEGVFDSEKASKIVDDILFHTISKEEVRRVVGDAHIHCDYSDKDEGGCLNCKNCKLNQERQRILQELNLIEK